MCRSNNVFLILLISLFLYCCSEKSPIEELRWLEGSWKQTNQKSSRLSLENWKYSNGELIGKGFTVDNSTGQYDTLFVERLRIIIREQSIFYEADLPTQDPVLFRLSEKQNEVWNFSNPKHDFPKYIRYEKTKSGFKALVGDGKRENSLEFERL